MKKEFYDLAWKQKKPFLCATTLQLLCLSILVNEQTKGVLKFNRVLTFRILKTGAFAL